MKHRVQLAGSLALGAAVLAATASLPTAVATPHAANAKHTTISTVKTSLGRVVSTSSGHVMFRFFKDGKDSSACKSSCQAVWPAVMSKKAAKAGSHIVAKHLGQTKTGQVTYYHHPLYFYVGDPMAGKTKGDGISEFGAKWYVVSPAGKPVKPKKTGPTDPGGYTPIVPNTAPVISTATESASHPVTELATSGGFTLYALASETSSTQVCSDANNCIPPFTPVLTDAANDTPTVAGTADSSKVGTFARTFGTTTVYQVTYNGHPLYTYANDAAAGDDKAQWMNTGGHFWGGVFPSGDINLALTP